MSDKFVAPDFLSGESYDEVLARMLKELPENISKEENGWVCDLFSPVAIEHARAVQFVLLEAIKNIIPKYSYGDILLGHAENRGIFKKAATYAEAVLKITGIPGTAIPSGFQFSTLADLDNAGIVFAAVAQVVIPEAEEAEINVRCLASGKIGNVAANTITLMVKPLKGIISITNEAAAYGGFEEETEESLRQRIADYDMAQGLSFVGSPADYRRWAMEVSGVGGANVLPATDDTGLVTIILRDLNGMPAGEDICKNVESHIMRPDSPYERLAPVNAFLKVIPANSIKMKISAVIEIEEGYSLEVIKSSFTSSVSSYFMQVSDELKYTEIGALLIGTEGVYDYANLKINDGVDNIPISLGDVPIVDSVVLEEK